jgi:hypothetical protein
VAKISIKSAATCATKIHFFQIFLTPFLRYSYENRESRIKYLFRLNRAGSFNFRKEVFSFEMETLYGNNRLPVTNHQSPINHLTNQPINQIYTKQTQFSENQK